MRIRTLDDITSLRTINMNFLCNFRFPPIGEDQPVDVPCRTGLPPAFWPTIEGGVCLKAPRN